MEVPEIVHLDSAEAAEYNEAGYLLDMSDFLKENKDIDDALDGMEDAFNDGKVQYGLIVSVDFSIIKICLIKLGLLIQQMIQQTNLRYDRKTIQDTNRNEEQWISMWRSPLKIWMGR